MVDVQEAHLFLPILAGGRRLNLILRSWDLYITAFQGEDQICRFLLNNDIELFETYYEAFGLKAEKLEIGDNYRGLEDAADVRRSQIKLGRQHMIDAVKYLATPYFNSQNPAAAILLLSRTIPEVLRSDGAWSLIGFLGVFTMEQISICIMMTIPLCQWKT